MTARFMGPLLPKLIEDTATHPGWSRLVIFCAPTGYDKTSTVSMWLGEGGPGSEVRWIRCSAGPADSVWQRIADAIDDSEAASEEAPLARARRLASSLTVPLTLVIDDYHHATSAENDLALADLCVASPMLSVVVLARRLRVLDGPLVTGRIRVRSFGPKDLSFSREDAFRMAALLGIPDSEQLRAAIDQADGWPLALRAAIDPLGLLSATDPQADAPPSLREMGSGQNDPLANLARFALHHLEIVGDLPRRLLLAASQLDAIDIDHAAEFLGVDAEQARSAVHALLELGLLVPASIGEAAEFHCHSSVHGPLAARSRRSFAPEQRAALFRGRAVRVESTAPFTAFRFYCAAEAYPEAESMLAWHFTAIIDDPAEARRLLGALPEPALVAHPIFTAARLFLELPDPTVPSPAMGYLISLWQRGIRDRLAADDVHSPLRIPLLTQAMVASRLRGDLGTAGRIAHELEQRFSAPLPTGVLSAGSGIAGDAGGSSLVERAAGSLPVYYSELGATALATGDLDRARRNWDHLRDWARGPSVSSSWASGAPAPAPTRSAADAASRQRWMLTALAEMAFTELLEGDMRRCAELLGEADAFAAESGATVPGVLWVGAEIARAHLAVEFGDEALLVQAVARLEPLGRRIEHWPLLFIAEAAWTLAQRGADWALAQLDARLGATRQPSTAWNEALTSYRAMLYTVLGDLATADQMLTALEQFAPHSTTAKLERARLALFAGDDVDALLLAQQVGDAESTRRQRLDRCLIAATSAWQCKRTQEAFIAMGHVAELLPGLPSALHAVPFEPLREVVVAARDAGVCDLVAVIDDVPEAARSRRYERLTEMEQRTLAAIAVHRNAGQAAAALFITPGTVKKHLASVYRKLHAKGRDEAILRATRMGLLPRSDAAA